RTRTFDGLIQGLTYEFFVKDALNCIKKNSDSVYVDFTPTVLITPTINKKSCFTTIPNTGTGQITFDIDNKSTHLDATFDWFIYKRLTPATKALITDPIIAQSPAGGETSLTITSPADLEAGTYYILLSNRIGTPVCQFGSLDIEIEQGTEIKGNLKNIKDITCALPGQIRIEGVNGGFGDYIYTATATEGATTTINGDIVSVSYPTTTPIPATVDVTVTVTDKNGCGITLTETLKVSQNPTINPVTVNSCGAVNTIAINTTDGLAPYQYSIDGGVTFTAPISTANHTMNVSDGLNQILTVKDANGCTATANFNVHPDITFDITNITVPSCDTSNNSANNATATITVNTGSGDYQYSLDGVLPAVDITGTTVTFPTTLTPGNHTIKIIDKQNATCTLQKTFTVSEPIKPSFTHTFTDSKCATDNSGTITLTSTEALTYTINPDPNSAGSITTNIFSALPPNTYTVTGKGTNSCTTEIKDIIITEFKAIIVPTPTVVNGGITQFACTAGNTRNSAIVKVNKLPKFGGSGTYTKAEFVFTPNGGGAVETPPASSSFEFTTDNVLGGTVDITVYDDKGCSGTTRAIIAAFTPIADLLATQKTPITCSANESIEVTFTGTATEIKVEQIPTIGTGYTQTPATASASGTIFTGLPVGKYTITIKNDKGCELTTSYTVKEIPAYTILLSDKIDTSCFGTATGSIKFDVDNYTGDYTYEIVTKAGASLSPAKTGTAVNGIQSISKLPKGEYKVKISTGTINCTVTDKDFKIEDALNGKLEVTASATEVSCIGGTSIITANATKGWGSYEYQLEVTGTPNVPYRSGDDFATNGNNNVFKNLPSGSYTVRVKDGNGCSDATFDVPEITNPTQVEFTVTKDDTVCDANIAGSITVDLKDAASGLAGGKPPYTYTLTNTTSGVVKTKTITDTEYTFTGLSKANY
ncbi:hypothetical protein G1K86_12570, partial [Tenacibaculum finnmarkense]|nr:hypothetical protein [Tenacibaculum finnmarkense]